MKYDIFLVDVDDTVLDFHAASGQALSVAAKSCGMEWNEGYQTRFRAFNGELWRRLEKGEITREYLMSNRFRLFFKELGLDETLGEKFNGEFLRYLSTTPIFIDGAKEFLKTLANYGRVYFVTNGTAWIQKSRFDICGLWSYAKETFVSDTIGYDKPSPLYTKFVTEHIEGFTKSRAIWIGDSLSSDIKAAFEAGIDSIWFTKKREAEGEVKPTYFASNYREIYNILGFFEKN